MGSDEFISGAQEDLGKLISFPFLSSRADSGFPESDKCKSWIYNVESKKIEELNPGSRSVDVLAKVVGDLSSQRGLDKGRVNPQRR
jgi:hypothetical protein